MTDEEYKQAIAELPEHVRIPEKKPPQEIWAVTKMLLSIIGKPLGSDDIARILNLDVWDVERALHQIC